MIIPNFYYEKHYVYSVFNLPPCGKESKTESLHYFWPVFLINPKNHLRRRDLYRPYSTGPIITQIYFPVRAQIQPLPNLLSPNRKKIVN